MNAMGRFSDIPQSRKVPQRRREIMMFISLLLVPSSSADPTAPIASIAL